MAHADAFPSSELTSRCCHRRTFPRMPAAAATAATAASVLGAQSAPVGRCERKSIHAARAQAGSCTNTAAEGSAAQRTFSPAPRYLLR